MTDPTPEQPADPQPSEPEQAWPEQAESDPASPPPTDPWQTAHVTADLPTTAVRRRRRRTSDEGWLRIVIVAWCFWLLGAWGVAYISDTSVPRVRWMLFAGSFGLMLAWPAFRLSERIARHRLRHGVSAVFLDWVALIMVYQAVIWSLALIASWPLTRGLWLDAAVASWSLLAALIVAATRLWPGEVARVVGMALCILLVFAEPVAIWAAEALGIGGWSMHVSPIQALWELTEPPGRGGVSPWDQRTMMIALIALSGWIALGLWMLGEKQADRRRARRAKQ